MVAAFKSDRKKKKSKDLAGVRLARIEGQVVAGRIMSVSAEQAMVEIDGYLTRPVPMREFSNTMGLLPKIAPGDVVSVYVGRADGPGGDLYLSPERARRETAWDQMEGDFENSRRVSGVISGRIDGGFVVDFHGAIGFLPESELDLHGVRDAIPLIGATQPFRVLRLNRRIGHIVVSRRAVLLEGALASLGHASGIERSEAHGVVRAAYGDPSADNGSASGKRVSRGSSDLSREYQRGRKLMPELAEGYRLGMRVIGHVVRSDEVATYVELAPGVVAFVNRLLDSAEIGGGHLTRGSQVEGIIVRMDEMSRRIVIDVSRQIAPKFGSLDHPLVYGHHVGHPSGVIATLDPASLPLAVKGTSLAYHTVAFGFPILGGQVGASGDVHVAFDGTRGNRGTDIIWSASTYSSLGGITASGLTETPALQGASELSAQAVQAARLQDAEIARSASDLLATYGSPDEAAATREDILWSLLESPEGLTTCLAAGIALAREGDKEMALEFCRWVHKMLLARGRDDLVPLVFLLQARIFSSFDVAYSRDLFAVEAAAAFVESGNMGGAAAALDLVGA